MIMKNSNRIFALLLIVSIVSVGCESVFGTKNDPTTEDIFNEGKIDPRLENVDGYAPVLPVWGDFDAPTDIHVGFDTFVYVTDANGLHLLDRADLTPRKTIELSGAEAVVQDRLLNVYVAARIDTIIESISPTISWNLPAIFKIKNMNGSGDVTFVDTLIFPFDDASLSTSAAQNARLNKNSANNYEKVKITGLAVLADNNIYATRTGPLNSSQQIAAPDNTVLEFSRRIVGGETIEKMVNVRQIVALNPVTPSLKSAIGLGSITTFVAPPQRDQLTSDRSFIITQTDQSADIDFRVLWIKAELTTDGLVYLQNSSLLAQDTSKASGFLYEPEKFSSPSDVAFSGDDDAFIFVVDELQNMFYQFQSSGLEGVNPPAGVDQSGKKVIVSFGGLGAGPKQFNQPSGVAYYNKVVYVADKGNNRILRFKLTSDFE